MESLLLSIYSFFTKHRTAFYSTLIASFLLLGYFSAQVKFEEDIAKILPKDKKIEKLTAVFQNSKFMDKLVVMVSLKDTSATMPDSLVAYAAAFEEKLKGAPARYIRKINGKVDEELAPELFNTISDHLPIYLEEKDYRAIDTLIRPDKLKETLTQDLKTLTSPAGIALKSTIENDPAGITFLGLKKLQQLQYDDNFELYENYILTKNQKHLLLFITPEFPPNNTGKNAMLLQSLDKAIVALDSTAYKYAGATYFGATAVSVGNALQLRKDTLLTQGITVFFILIFLGIYFKKKSAPFIIMMPVLFGVLFSLAAIYFIKGSISVIALGTGSVVLGIAVNYSLHVFNHYRHTNNVRQVIKDLTLPLTVGSFTTIGGFLCLEFVKSEMLKDLGLFAAFSLVGASICSLIFLPHFIGLKQAPAGNTQVNLNFIDKLAASRPEYNKYLVMGIFALTIFFGFEAKNVGFESDLNKMNFMSPALKLAEKELNSINQYALQSVYVVTEGKNLEEALQQNEKLLVKIEGLEAKNIIKKHSGVSSFLISAAMQKTRISRWENYWTESKKIALLSTLKQQGQVLKFSPAAFDKFKMFLNKKFTVSNSAAIEELRKNFLDDYITEKPYKTTVVTLIKVLPESKAAVYKAFENDPNITVLDKQYLATRFVNIINNDFTSIAIMTSLLVFFVLLIMYGRLELTLVSFIPMFISWVWILGIMSITGLQFNIINIIISALIFGLGDDYSLFIMDGLLQEYKTGRRNLSSFKSSILLSAITTIAGLGVLIFAKHPALQSIALISIVGIGCVVIMSQILIPYFFAILITNRVQRQLAPWTLTNFHKSTFAFSLFISVSIFFTVLGRIFVHINVNEKGKYVYHFLISKACKFLMVVMVNVKKKIINPLQENFHKPAVIICNHQSSLDIVALLSLYPKILMFTNNKKWNAPFFGPVIRMADYFPAEQVDQHLNKIADRIAQGYSIVIFPEGTRSEDGTIKRFHKGAFYLAEKLNIDILPILIHGTDYTLTKKDALLKDGIVTLKFLPRIATADTNYGNGYAEKSKNIARYFRAAFNTLKIETEKPSYFREKLIYNYIYKGPLVEWYMRIKTKLENNYQPFHQLVPAQGAILDIGCGYGFMAYMLYFTANSRTITGIDYDEEKIDTANNCFDKPSTLNFVHTDVLNFDFQRYDAIIMADILHYLPAADQKLVIEKCIDHLKDGGKIIIREGNKEAALKHKRTELTEYFSTRLFKFNKTVATGLSFLSAGILKEIAQTKGLTYQQISDSNITSNTIFILQKELKYDQF